ncbi:MAG TPA: ferrochelatase [Thermoanaerobaculia bacterium]|nr:ferrochelatase [Thermoanaerobaculia bacterium]HQR67341.1 ferrochelatase [Thermoanaerobaculia bacterium]
MAGRVGVLLVQLGGPEKREELRPFLYELFADPEIIGLPAPLRQVVAFLIAVTRAPKSAVTYERIGWSPIRRWSRTQAALLERELSAGGAPAAVRVGMTCSEPTVEGALAELREAGATRLVVLPLYPQYSVTTTRSSFDRVTRALARMGWSPERLDAPDAWYDEPHFVAAHADRIRAAAATLPDPDPAATVLLYSAHSLPVATVEKKKDPYPKHVEGTIAALDAALGRRFRSRLGYQSKVGPMPWLAPSTGDVLAELGAGGVKQVVVAPVAFVSDHVETLYECDILFREEAARAGIAHYVVTEGLNDHPEFIRSLAAIVAGRLGGGA